MKRLLSPLRALWHAVLDTPAEAQPIRRSAYPRQPCPRCGVSVAITRDGHTWPHKCGLSGYGIVLANGTFESWPDKRRRGGLVNDSLPDVKG